MEELLLVKGIDADLFYGYTRRAADGRMVEVPGLNRCLTVFGTPAGINVNSAPFPVLVALGFPPEMADNIIKQREGRPFKDQQDFSTRVPEAPGMDKLKAPVITRSPIQSSFFSLVSTGMLKNSNVKRTIFAVVRLDADPGRLERAQDEMLRAGLGRSRGVG